jgi:hypothetical protein
LTMLPLLPILALLALLPVHALCPLRRLLLHLLQPTIPGLRDLALASDHGDSPQAQ